MGKKYIIELEDKPFHKEDGDFLYRVKGFNSLVFDMTGISKLTLYTAPDLGQVRKEAYKIGYEKGYDAGHNVGYQQGLSDAWEVVKKLAQMDTDTSESITGYFGLHNIMHNLTASEAIEKIRQYEQEQQIQVGDEVRNIENGWIAVVSNIDGECMTLMNTDGALGDGYNVNRFTKTGRHFPEIAAVLEKMRGEQDG